MAVAAPDAAALRPAARLLGAAAGWGRHAVRCAAQVSLAGRRRGRRSGRPRGVGFQDRAAVARCSCFSPFLSVWGHNSIAQRHIRSLFRSMRWQQRLRTFLRSHPTLLQ